MLIFSVTSYYYYGMSAGCQFGHRMGTFTSATKIKAAICASAGFYTLPVLNKTFPYGLQHAPTLAKLNKHFCRNTIMMVGGNDTNRDSAFLQTPEADEQVSKMVKDRYLFR